MGPEIVMYQRWCDLLFVHWEVDPGSLRSFLPEGLEPDLFDGRCWVALIPFTMRGIRPRFLVPVPGVAALHEINLRTYVRHGDLSGVFFFSLDATSRIAVQAARMFYRLPYHYARISLERDGVWIEYQANRRAGNAGCDIRYRGTGPSEAAVAGSLEHFLIERYRLFAARNGKLWSAKVYHDPYPVQTGEAFRLDETYLRSAGVVPLSTNPLLHYSPGVSVRIGRLRRL